MRETRSNGYLPKEASIFRGLNVEQNNMSVLEGQNYNQKPKIQKIRGLLAEFNINKIRN